MLNYKSKGNEEAIPLISFDGDSKKFSINSEALDFITALPQPIGVVAMAGMYRTGKSYLLNRTFLDRSDGFGVGPTVNPCTKGLWIWNRALRGQTATGEPCSVLVIDSEGIGALDEDQTHDSRIFALTILLSSCFVYNSVGSIDETAISSLSLVINLTKHIQLKSQPTLSSDQPTDDLSQYFPSFYWIVRDFSLQLVDEEGEALTARNYLEKALQQQKGLSDDVESKNRIRRLLSTFFKERDCMTMVRPLMKEENLQNLANVDYEQLRPEFRAQVKDLKKRIVGRMKCKQLQGKNLSGAMFCDLIRSCVSAINQGAAPVIESAWTYICRNECSKSIQDSLEVFEERIREQCSNRFPMLAEDMKCAFKLAKMEAEDVFRRRAVGDVIEEYRLELQNRMKVRCSVIKKENEREAYRQCVQFIQVEFEHVEQKIKRGQYRNFPEMEKDIRLFCTYFIENAPLESQSRQLILLERINSALLEGTASLMRMVGHEVESQRVAFEEANRAFQQEIKDMKLDRVREREASTAQMVGLEKEKFELQQRNTLLSESLDALQKAKQLSEEGMQNEFQSEKEELMRQCNDLKDRLLRMEDSQKDLERKKHYGMSEVEKTKALFNQKIDFLQKQVEEAARKESDLNTELKNQKIAFLGQQRDAQNKLDQTVQQLTKKVSDLQEKLQEVENEMSENEQKYLDDLKHYQQKEASTMRQNNELQELCSQLQKEQREQRRNQDCWLEQNRATTDQQSQRLNEQLTGALQDVQAKEEQLKQLKHQFEKDRAILQQRVEFMELQLAEGRRQMEESRKAHDAIMKVFEGGHMMDSSYTKGDSTKLAELREQHKKELRAIEVDFEMQRKSLQSQLEQLTERNTELEMKVNLEASDLTLRMGQLRSDLLECEKQRAKAELQAKNLEKSKQAMLVEQEQRFSGRIRELEDEVDRLKQHIANDISSNQERAEEQLVQLKHFYELERERLEGRICEEKEKATKRLNSTQDKYEQQLKDTEQHYEEELELLKEEMRDQEANAQNIIQQYEHDKQIKQQTIENLESKIKDLRESNLNFQNSHNNSLEQQMNMFAAERKEMVAKNEAQSETMAKLQKDIMTIEQRRDFLENEKVRKEVQLEQLRRVSNEERKELTDKLDEVKHRLQTINDEYLEKKIEYGRELALVQQQNEFQLKKIEDLQRTLETQSSRFEEKLKLQKVEIQAEMGDKIDRYNDEKITLEQKYERTKKSLKEAESGFNRQLANIDRERVVLSERLQSSESKAMELEVKLRDEMQQSAQLLQTLKDAATQDKKALMADLEKLKGSYLQLDKERNDTLASYERDKALWEGKFQFLEQQKEQAKQDLVDALKKFEMTLMHLQRARNNERDELESNLSDLVSNVEKKYQTQIEELNQSHQRTIQEYDDKFRRLQKEMKQHKDQLLIDQHGKIGNHLLSEKKFSEMLENEKRLHNEIEGLKQERDQKVSEYAKMFDQERDHFKGKIAELEAKYKEIENKRNSLIFEFEKERAKWNLDKDHLMNLKNEISDQLEKVERKKELLLRENEKLKNEQRATRRSVNTVHNMTSNTLLNANKYKPGGINNVSTIAPSNRNQQLSPTHSCNTSTSSAILGHKPYQSNMADITNTAHGPIDCSKSKQQNQPFYMLGDEIQTKYSTYYENFKNTSPLKQDQSKQFEKASGKFKY